MAAQDFPFDIVEFNEEEDALSKVVYAANTLPCIKIGPDSFVAPGEYREMAAAVYNMKVRPDDIWIVTYPRSGTTSTQELIWLVANNLDYEKAKTPLVNRFTFLEIVPVFAGYGRKSKLDTENFGVDHMKRALDPIEAAPSPRFIKTHVPLSLLPPALLSTAKVVYVARDPRDVAVSFYHHHKNIMAQQKPSTFLDFWELYRRSLIRNSPISTHVKEAHEKKNHPNLLFLMYEELLKDLPSVIRRMCKFLGCEYSDDQIQQLATHLHIDNFKKNKAIEIKYSDTTFNIVRQGKAGVWKKYFDYDMMLQADKFFANYLQETNMQFPE